MLSDQIAVIRERVASATPGPWSYDSSGFVSAKGTLLAQTWSKYEVDFDNHAANGKFIAHAREDIPKLLAEIERLQAECRRAYADGRYDERLEYERKIDRYAEKESGT